MTTESAIHIVTLLCGMNGITRAAAAAVAMTKAASATAVQAEAHKPNSHVFILKLKARNTNKYPNSQTMKIAG